MESEKVITSRGKFNLSLVLTSTVTGVIVCWVLWFSGHGFDFTDEGFYLNSIATPELFKYSVTQFGFVYHPLYWITGGNIVALRQINVAITAGLATITGFYCIRSLTRQNFSVGKTAVLAAGFSVASLTLFEHWLLTPNYNTLAFQSLLVASTGLFMTAHSNREPNYHPSVSTNAGAILTGVGGALAFLAKPTTASVLALLAAGYLLIANPRRAFRAGVVAISSAALLMIITAITIDGSPTQFAQRLMKGVELAKLLGGGHTLEQILRLDELHIDFRNKMACLILFIVTAAGSYFADSSNPKLNRGASTLIFALSLTTILIPFAGPRVTFKPGEFHGLIMAAVPAAIFSLGLLYTKVQKQGRSVRLAIANCLLCFGLPYAYAFGTNGNYWNAASFAGFFWVLGGLSFLPLLKPSDHTEARLVPAIAVIQFIAALLLSIGMASPYRQAVDIRRQESEVTIGSGHSVIRVSTTQTNLLESAWETSRRAGFTDSTPLLDLTGQSPGLVFALNAEAVGQAWNIGGYPGSLELAQESIKNWPCDKLSQTWVLMEPAGPRSISETLLSTWGANLTRDYEIAGTWSLPHGSRSQQKVRDHVLYKPKNDAAEALLACLKHRSRKPS